MARYSNVIWNTCKCKNAQWIVNSVISDTQTKERRSHTRSLSLALGKKILLCILLFFLFLAEAICAAGIRTKYILHMKQTHAEMHNNKKTKATNITTIWLKHRHANKRHGHHNTRFINSMSITTALSRENQRQHTEKKFGEANFSRKKNPCWVSDE